MVLTVHIIIFTLPELTNILACSEVSRSPSLQTVCSLVSVTIPFCKMVGSPNCLKCGSNEWGKSGNPPASKCTVSVALKPVRAKSCEE